MYFFRISVCIMFSALFVFSFVESPSVLWYCWLGLLTCKNRLPYNLYCVGRDVKHCTINQSVISPVWVWWPRSHYQILSGTQQFPMTITRALALVLLFTLLWKIIWKTSLGSTGCLQLLEILEFVWSSWKFLCKMSMIDLIGLQSW